MDATEVRMTTVFHSAMSKILLYHAALCHPYRFRRTDQLLCLTHPLAIGPAHPQGLTSLTYLDGFTALAELRAGTASTVALGGSDLPFALARYWPRNASTLTTLAIK
jgi:hypothetical protein